MKKIKRARKYVLTPTDVSLIRVSRFAEDVSVAQAGAEAQIPPRHMKRALARLEEQGLVVTGADRMVIRLTEAGLRVKRIVRQKKSERPTFLGRLTSGSMRLLTDLGLQEPEPQVLVIPDAEDGVLTMSNDQITHALDEMIARKR